MSNRLTIVPIFQREAFAFIQKHHRHHKKPVGSVFQIGCSINGELVGVVVVGRPVARSLQDSYTLEVTRLCTDGTKNACSILYSAAWRVAKNLGYNRLITYILGTENGASLRAANWQLIGQRGGGTWNRITRNRTDKHPTEPKLLFEKKHTTTLYPLNHKSHIIDHK